ncbi:cyanophycinase [Pseudoduganella lutea]|uniref:Cyanophycinase n=1 Tax=Pseudoduganella lutea TaxID=321985 RepID=A0A4P6KVL8_9BURK|nr:cyanophycinase [Pseudoduganella lutea]QBE63181.1 cyanophycinase [Pseudoduganella lutea]
MTTPTKEDGCLLIIGGDEQRQCRERILARFVELAGGPGHPDPNVVLLTSASQEPEEMARPYQEALARLGVTRCDIVHAANREQANDPAVAERIAHADGILITGGDQKRLMATIGGTAVDQALHEALKRRCACVAGTSAGASAMAGHMLASGSAEYAPAKGAATLGAGLGFVQHIVIDQHFSQRHRINRLLSLIAQNPYLYGLGIDEDTALVVERGVGIEVIGDGGVTLVDGRAMITNAADIGEGEQAELIGVQLHVLPAGSGYLLPGAQASTRLKHIEREAPAPIQAFISNLTKRNPLS